MKETLTEPMQRAHISHGKAAFTMLDALWK